jgi:cysteine desulfurase
LNCEAKEIFFTSGGTEADNLALLGTVNQGEHLITTEIEHHAVLNTAHFLEKNGRQVTYVKPDEYGMIHPENIARAITTNTKLVSVMHVNNEVGTINPIEQISQITKSRGVLFHVDAVQAFGKLPLDLSVIPVDLLSISSHKIYGPKGVGALFIREGTQIQSRAFGGHHERGIRAGTENLPGIVGFARAAQICQEVMAEENIRIRQMRDDLYQGIMTNYPDVILNGHPSKRLYTICNLSFPNIEGETMLISLDLEGIAVSTGSACSSGSTEPSHVLLAMGLSKELAQSSIRFSLGRENEPSDIQRAVEVVISIVHRMKKMSI